MSSVFEDRCSVVDVRKEGGGQTMVPESCGQGPADSRY